MKAAIVTAGPVTVQLRCGQQLLGVAARHGVIYCLIQLLYATVRRALTKGRLALAVFVSQFSFSNTIYPNRSFFSLSVVIEIRL